MPDPLHYLAAIGAAALAAALLVAAIGWPRRSDKPEISQRQRIAAPIGLAGGLLAGFWVLDLYVSWPPVNALDRFLTILLPLAVGVELLGAFERVPRWLTWALRLALVAGLGRVLLHGSVYLTNGYPAGQTLLALVISASLTAAVWGLLAALAKHSPSIRIPMALCITMIGSGLAIMLSGYVSGGAATLPLSAAIAAATAVSALLSRQIHVDAATGIGVIGLAGLLFIGRYFGGLSDITAVALLLAPLVCWTTELARLWQQSSGEERQ